MGDPLVSLVITSYNYAAFLRAAIDSALAQTYPRLEVIVVDDGSADGSPEIIVGYGARITKVFKENGGQGSAINSGFAASHGDVVCFIDSDDTLLASAVERAVEALRDPVAAKAHWPLWEIDGHGRMTGHIIPDQALGEGDVLETVVRYGPAGYLSPPTTGNAWARRFLEKVLPMPEAAYKTSPDAYLVTLAPLFGTVARIPQPQGCCRLHGRNEYNCKTPDERNARNLELYELRCGLLARTLAARGIEVDPRAWKDGNEHYEWMRRFLRSAQEIRSLVREGGSFILVDEAWWGDRWGAKDVIAGRHSLPFLERNGEYAGRPSDGAEAVRELRRLRRAGAELIVFADPCFWWLAEYSELGHVLRSEFTCVIENDRLIAFDLRAK